MSGAQSASIEPTSLSVRGRPIQYTVLGLVVLVTFAACFFGVVRTLLVSVSAENLTPAQANRVLRENFCQLRVPEQGSNVAVFARFQTGGAAFDIPERNFLDWARDHEWNIARVQPATDPTWHSPLIVPAWPQNTKDAWFFSNGSHRGGWDVMYDRERRRAYVYFAPR
jgi:hypothetical protein